MNYLYLLLEGVVSMFSDDCEVFLTVERMGSLTKAAKVLHLSQPTVSHRLKSLEAIIGITLFERKKGQKKSA